jgi:hypothetical protein
MLQKIQKHFVDFRRIFISSFVFSNVFGLVANKEDLLHVTSYHYYLLAKIHLYQSYFNMSCHWHMNMCYLIRFYVDMLTLFNILLTNEQIPMSKVSIYGKCLCILECENNHYGVGLILFIVFNLIFTYPNLFKFLFHKL